MVPQTKKAHEAETTINLNKKITTVLKTKIITQATNKREVTSIRVIQKTGNRKI